MTEEPEAAITSPNIGMCRLLRATESEVGQEGEKTRCFPRDPGQLRDQPAQSA